MNELTKYKPCSEAVEFRSEYSTFKEAWDNCPRGDWMLWIASKLEVNIHMLTYAKALCVETVIHLMTDERSINAVKVAKRFGKYKATREDLKTASDDADAAYDAAYDDAYTAAAAAYAADAAYDAAYDDAYTAAAAAYAAAAACDAAYAAAAAASDDADDAYDAAAYAAAAAYAKKDNQMLTANICRKHLTKAVLLKLKHK